MEIAPYGIVDISPRLIGSMNLLLSASGMCDISEYACGSTWGRSIVQGNYSDINLSIGPFTCIQAINMMSYSVHIDYAWHIDIDSMVMLVFFWLMIISSCCTCIIAISGRLIVSLASRLISKRTPIPNPLPSAPPSMYSTIIAPTNDTGNSGEPLHQQ